jgi:hypothetical protein
MATVLTVGDIAIVQYNSSTTDAFTFVFLRDVEVGTTVNFTDNGWLAAGGFRPGEGTVTYTAPSAITAGTVVTLSGLNLDDAGDQIIAYQGDASTPTILHVVDLADGNNTVAGDATNDNTTALPPGFTLDVNAVAVGFDNAVYAGPNGGPPDELFPLINDPANWISSVSPSALYFYNDRPRIDLDGNNSTSFGEDYRANVISGGPGVRIADTDTDIDDFDDHQGADRHPGHGSRRPAVGRRLAAVWNFRLGFRFLQRHPYAVRGGVAFRLSDCNRADQVQHDPAGRHPQDDRSQCIRRA